MERLTERTADGTAIFSSSNFAMEEAAQRLAEYEETGLTPAEVKEMMTDWVVWKEAEAAGRLMVLPCCFGKVVYTVVKTDRRRGARATGGFVYSVTWNPLTWNNLRHVIEDFGKTVFRTRAEAQAAMERMRKEANNGNS